jgi:small subunit ribosomal protein S20
VANHPSAEKRNRQRIKRRLRNRLVVGRMRTAIKSVRAALDPKNEATGEKREELLKSAISLIDKAKSKGAIKAKAAARTISRLTQAVSRAA